MILLPTGFGASDLSPRIEGGGTQVKVEFTWKEELLDQKLPIYAGSRAGEQVYQPGHVKVVGFNDSVKLLRNNKEDRPVKSIFRCPLLATVEEQFTDVDVHRPVYIQNFHIKDHEGNKMKASCLCLEMMVLRDNYKTYGNIEELDLDFSNLSV